MIHVDSYTGGKSSGSGSRLPRFNLALLLQLYLLRWSLTCFCASISSSGNGANSAPASQGFEDWEGVRCEVPSSVHTVSPQLVVSCCEHAVTQHGGHFASICPPSDSLGYTLSFLFSRWENWSWSSLIWLSLKLVRGHDLWSRTSIGILYSPVDSLGRINRINPAVIILYYFALLLFGEAYHVFKFKLNNTWRHKAMINLHSHDNRTLDLGVCFVLFCNRIIAKDDLELFILLPPAPESCD